MAMDGLRGYLLLASGLADMSRAKATEAASALLSLSSGLTGGRSSSNVQLQVQDLAEELLAAAAANRRSLIALVRSEVERAVARSPIPPDELDRARAAVAKLSADVEALQAQILTNPAVGEVAGKLGLAGHAVSRPADEGSSSTPPSPARSSPARSTSRSPPRPADARRASRSPTGRRPVRSPPTPVTTGPSVRPSLAASTEPAVTTTTTAPAKTAATKKAAPAKKAATKKAATNKAATKKAATKRAAAKKAARPRGLLRPQWRRPQRHQQEGCHQEGRHQEGRYGEEGGATTTAGRPRRRRRGRPHRRPLGASVRRGDHEEGGEEDDLIGGRSGASVRRGDHEEGAHGDVRRHEVSSDEVRRQEVRRQEVRRDARHGERRMTAGIDESGEWPQQSDPAHHGRGGTPHRRRPGRRGAGAAPRQCRVRVPRRAGRGRRGGAPSVAGPAGRPRR